MADGKPGDNGGQRGPGGGPGGGPEGGNQGKRFGRRRGYRGRSRRDRPGEGQDRQGAERQSQGKRPAEAEEPDYVPASRIEDGREPTVCPLCGKPVYDLSTALSSGKEEGDPAHFDCVLDRVSAAETLEPGEKIVYLGSGAFAVVAFKDRNETAFTVKRRIQWEKEGEKKDWRKGLSSRIANL